MAVNAGVDVWVGVLVVTAAAAVKAFATAVAMAESKVLVAVGPSFSLGSVAAGAQADKLMTKMRPIRRFLFSLFSWRMIYSSNVPVTTISPSFKPDLISAYNSL